MMMDDDEDVVIPDWMETNADKQARLEREKRKKEQAEAALREHTRFVQQMCRKLVEDLFVDKVVQIAYFRDMNKRSNALALQFGEEAACQFFKRGLAYNPQQDELGGLMYRPWRKTHVPEEDEMEALVNMHKKTGDWIDRARKHVKLKFKGGQKDIVRQPKITQDITTYVGGETKKGFRPLDKLGPSWRELYVGQRVIMTTEAITTREKFRLPDLAGVSARRANGDSVYRAIQECSGIIINVCTDFSLQTDVTYAPGAKITNYICFPGGGCWVRWFETKEVTYYWSERLEPTKDFNTVDDIERRTDLIEKEDWAVLDAEAAELKNATARMSDKIVEKLRDKAMSARVRTHDQFIHRYERRSKAPPTAAEIMRHKSHKKLM